MGYSWHIANNTLKIYLNILNIIVDGNKSKSTNKVNYKEIT